MTYIYIIIITSENDIVRKVISVCTGSVEVGLQFRTLLLNLLGEQACGCVSQWLRLVQSSHDERPTLAEREEVRLQDEALAKGQGRG